MARSLLRSLLFLLTFTCCAAFCAEPRNYTADVGSVASAKSTRIKECGAFFNGAVFIGDSITQGLQNYVIRQRKQQPDLLGGASFAAVKNYNLRRASSLSVGNPALTYRGESYNLPDIVNAMNAKKVFIMLGMNDGAGKNIKDSLEKFSKMIDNIQKENPSAEIYIQSMSPVTECGQTKYLKNSETDALNVSLRKLCGAKKVNFIDIATALKDENGGLRREYSSDDYVHMSAEGAKAWVGALYDYALENLESENGGYTNEAE